MAALRGLWLAAVLLAGSAASLSDEAFLGALRDNRGVAAAGGGPLFAPEAAARIIRTQDQAAEVQPWRFFYAQSAPAVIMWRRSGDASRVPQFNGAGKPGNLVFEDLALSKETDRFGPGFEPLNAAVNAAKSQPGGYLIGTAALEAGVLTFRAEPLALSDHLEGLKQKLQGAKVGQFVVRKMVPLKEGGRSLSESLGQIAERETWNFGYCDGDPRYNADDNGPVPTIVVWQGPAVHVPLSQENRQAVIKAAIAEHAPVAEAEGETCVIGDVARLEGSNQFLTAHVVYRLFDDDAPRETVELFRTHLRTVFGHLPSAFPADHQVPRAQVGAGQHAAKWPAIWGDRVDDLRRPKMTPRRLEYAGALAAELARLFALGPKLGHVDYARKVAPFTFRSDGDAGLPVLLVGEMKAEQWAAAGAAAGKGAHSASGFLQVSMETDSLSLTVTQQSSPLGAVELRGALAESLGGMIVEDADALTSILRLRHASVSVELA